MEPQQAISSDLIRGHIDTIILHALINGDKFAQQISDFIEEKSNGEYKINQATLYSSLKRLETLKYVNSYWYDSGSANGRRKFFKITESGANTVDENLKNWSYSRSLIDKLIDCEPTQTVKTEHVEKIVEVPKIVEVEKFVEVPKIVEVEKIVEVPTPPQKNDENDFLKSETPQQINYKSILGELTPENSRVEIEKSADETAKQENFNEIQQYEGVDSVKIEESVKSESLQEINYKNILSGLIKVTAPKKAEKPSVKELKPIETNANDEKIQDNQPQKLKFNETLVSSGYNSKSNYNGKIDFGDLMLKAANEGYKIRISSKDSGISPTGKLLVNKVNLCSALTTYLLCLIELLVVILTSKQILGMTTASTLTTLGIITVFPVVMCVLYFIKPNKATNKTLHADVILTVAIIVFNLLLITFAANLLCNVDFSNAYSLLMYLVIPAIVYVDALIYFLSKVVYSRMKAFNNKIKK